MSAHAFRVAVAVVLGVQLVGFSAADLRAEAEKPVVESAGPAAGVSPVDLAGQEAWRKEFNGVRTQRNVLLGGSVAAVVAGGVVYVAAMGDMTDAKNTPGCDYSGGTIYCADEASRAAAQDQLDSSQQKMLIGAAVSLGGLGLALWGAFKSGEMSRLERAGEKKGYSLSLEPRGMTGMELLVRRTF
ncbi:MAG: hypothetical protein IPP35_10620 [Elusimicrobia bacterium]|nr:hypothetical protein [Elusimicrobiota bacterium]